MARWFQYQAEADPPTIPVVAATVIAITVLSSPVFFKSRLIYQAKAEPLTISESITVDKWFEPLSEPSRRKGLATAQQQSIAFQFPVADRPIGGVPVSLDGPPSSVRLLQYQSIAYTVPAEEVVTVDKWFEPLSESVRTRKLSTAQIPASTIGTNPVVSFGWYGWLSDPVRSRPFKTSLQQFYASGYASDSSTLLDGYVPWSEPVRTRYLRTAQQQTLALPENPVAEVIYEDKWHFAWSEPVRTKQGLSARFQQPYTSGYLPDPSRLPEGWIAPFSDPVRTKKLHASQQQFLAWEPVFTVEAIFEDKWHQPWSEPIRVRKLATAQQKAYFAPDATIPRVEAVVPSTASSEVIYKSRFIYQSLAYAYFTPPAVAVSYFESVSGGVSFQKTITYQESAEVFLSVNEIAWLPPLAEPVRTKRLPVSDQQVLAWSTFTPSTEDIFEDKWHFPWSEPVRQKKGLATHEQQFLAYSFSKPIVSFGWYNWLSEPVKPEPGLAARLQQFFTTDPTIPRAGDLPAWWLPLAEPVRTRRFPTAEQQAFVWGIVSVTEVIYEDKWHYPWSEPIRLKRGLGAQYQQTLALAPTPPIVSFSYFNWLAEPVRLKKGLRTDEQQFLAYSFSKPIVSFGYYNWLTDPVRLKKGLRSDQQQTFVGPPLYPNLPTTIPWYAPLSEPVMPKKGLLARLQQFFGIGQPSIAAPPVTVILDATETNNDVAEFYAVVYNRPVLAYVSIKEIPRAGDAYVSIEEI